MRILRRIARRDRSSRCETSVRLRVEAARLRRRQHKERNSREPQNNRDLCNSLNSLVWLSNGNARSSALNVRLVQRKLNVRCDQRNSNRGVNV